MGAAEGIERLQEVEILDVFVESRLVGNKLVLGHILMGFGSMLADIQWADTHYAESKIFCSH
jgi:hypothetical protein